MIKIGALVSGGGTNLQAILDAIDKGGTDAEVTAVVSSKEGAYALERARARGIENTVIRKKDFNAAGDYERALVKYFKERNIDLIVLAGFMVVLGSEFINEFENRIINIHPALIPSFCGKGYYGLRVHEAALNAGVKITGATVHFVTADCDAGPIILQKAVEVKDDDTPEILQKRVMEQAEWVIYPEAVKLFAQNRLKIVDGIVKRV
ncbi:MAG: phosphoribosylglycinamide formyltransferase [Clostridia bacterium]|nr:phosphoribosylglycinamide formyltransferase [Clostridia bacterium]